MAIRGADVQFTFFAQPDFSKTPFSLYVANIPSFADILKTLNDEGIFLDKESISYTMRDFLKDYFKDERSVFAAKPITLLTAPLQQDFAEFTLTRDTCPEPFLELFPKIIQYIETICDVLNNELAQKPYEKLADREYVTERIHALQAGKISEQLKMTLEDVLALLFHDIARPSINDPEYGHSKHAQEGSIILAPLGTATDYAGHHTFAKFLLFKFCPEYQHLISATSKHTLKIQSPELADHLEELNKLSSPQLAHEMYKIMFMRLIDDMSKVPFSEEPFAQTPEYFSEERIKTMLHRQLHSHLHHLMKSNIPQPLILLDFEDKLMHGLSLLQRAKPYTYHPEVYMKEPHPLHLTP